MNAYVVLEHAGEDGQTEIIDFPTRRAAYLFITEHYDADDVESLHVDVVKRTADGGYTTEF